MPLTLSGIPGLVDRPDALLAAGETSMDSLLVKINGNAKMGACRPEFFYGEYVDGETVPLPESLIDGCNFTIDECFFVWALRYSYDYATGKPTAKGEELLEATGVDQSTGLVSIPSLSTTPRAARRPIPKTVCWRCGRSRSAARG